MSGHYEKGRVLYQQRRYDLAETEFRKALANDPTAPLAHAMLAASLSAQGQPGKGVKEAEAAIRLAPDIAYPYYILSLSQLACNRTGDAEKTIKEALRIDPTSPTYLAHAADVQVVKENWKEALKFAEAGLQNDPEDVNCINTRAQVLVRLNRFAEAEDSLEFALRLDPEDSMTHSNLGWVAVRRGRINDAIEHFKEALRLDPNSDWAYEGVVEALKARNPFYHLLLMSSLHLQETSGHMRSALYWFFWVVPPLRAALLLFIIVSFITRTLFTLLLRLDPLGRRVLNDKTKRRNNASLVLVGIIIAFFALLASNPDYFKPATHKIAAAGRDLFKNGDTRGGVAHWEQVLSEARQLEGRAISELNSDHFDKAENTIKDLIDTVETTYGVDARLKFRYRMALGDHFMRRNQYTSAALAYEEAAESVQTLPSKLLHAEAMSAAGGAYLQGGYSVDIQSGIERLRTACKDYESEGNPNTSQFRQALRRLAESLKRMGNDAAAAALLKKVQALESEKPGLQSAPTVIK